MPGSGNRLLAAADCGGSGQLTGIIIFMHACKLPFTKKGWSIAVGWFTCLGEQDASQRQISNLQPLRCKSSSVADELEHTCWRNDSEELYRICFAKTTLWRMQLDSQPAKIDDISSPRGWARYVVWVGARWGRIWGCQRAPLVSKGDVWSLG
jgi:hypothetical protein